MTTTGVNAQCPHCRGKGRSEALVLRAGRNECDFEMVDCTLCGGSGIIPRVIVDRLAAGRSLRGARVVHDLSVREAAEAMGLTPARLSGIESRGVEPTTEEIEAIERVLGVHYDVSR